MAITGPSSYVPTIGKFKPHWNQSNKELGENGPLVAENGITIEMLGSYGKELSGFASNIQDKLNDQEIASGFIELQRGGLLERLRQFNRKVRGKLGNTPYVKALPNVPTETSAEPKIIEPLNDMASLWGKINAATIPNFAPPLLLLEGYGHETFLTELAALKKQYETWGEAEQELKLERERRNKVQEKAYAAMRDYRKAVQGEFPADHALVTSLPRLTPAAGSKPDAVAVTGTWLAQQQKAKITWEASTDAKLDHYEIRWSPGSNYSTEDEAVLADIGKEDPREYLTDQGLAEAGQSSSFKVYVVTTSENEKGSAPVTVKREPA